MAKREAGERPARARRCKCLVPFVTTEKFSGRKRNVHAQVRRPA